MNSVEFEEDGLEIALAQNLRREVPPGVIIILVMKTGIAKNQRQATRLIALLSIICLLLSGYFFWIALRPALPSAPEKASGPYIEDLPPDVRAQTPQALLDELPSRNTSGK